MSIRYRLALVRQYDQADCGPAALTTLVRYLGGRTPLPVVRDLCGTTRSGTSLAQLSHAARALGLDADACSGTYDALCALAIPAIAHLMLPDGREHFAVVFRANARTVIIGDPAQGCVRLSREDFEAQWRSRAALCVWAAPHIENGPEYAPAALIRTALRGQRVWLGQCVFLGLAVTALGLTTSAAIQFVIDDLLPRQQQGLLFATAALLAGIVAVRVALGLARQQALVALSSRVGINLDVSVIRALFALPVRFFETRRAGDLTARLTDLNVVQAGIMRLVGACAIDVWLVAGGSSLLFLYAAPLGTVVFLVLIAYAGLLWRSIVSLKGRQGAAIGRFTDLEASYIDAIRGIETVVATETRDFFTRTLIARSTRYQRAVAHVGVEQARLMSTADGMASALTLAVLTIGACMVIQHSLRIGEMVLAYSLVGLILPAASRLVEAAASLQAMAVSIHRLEDVLSARGERANACGPLPPCATVELNHVGFERQPGEIVLDEISATFRRGELTAITGPTGSGKSTLIRVLLGMQKPSRGAIRVDGVDVREIGSTSLRRAIGFVPEHVRLFNGSIAENIALGRAGIDRAAIHAAAETLGFRNLFASFDGGIDANIGEDARQPSAGERQAIGLVRALAPRPAMLIIDEGLNALSPDFLPKVLAALVAYAREHIVVIVSHDRRVVAHADVHLELRAGGLVVRRQCIPLLGFTEVGRHASEHSVRGSSKIDEARY